MFFLSKMKYYTCVKNYENIYSSNIQFTFDRNGHLICLQVLYLR